MSIDISVVVLNFNGRQYLDDCIGSLAGQTYPAERTEIFLVDNGSSDGSAAYVRERWPRVRVVELKENLGFAAGNNVGVKEARGDFIALLNNDARAHPDWIKEGLATLRRSLDVGMVASKILALDEKTLDYAGGALSFYGHGFKVGVNEKDEGRYDRPRETLFASGCALFIPRPLYLETGGFDEDYFAFFEDVDLGWRLWALGYRVLYEPASLVYHRHHGTADRFGHERERFLLERNALFTIVKNYESHNLEKVLPAALLLAVERGLSYASVDRNLYDLASQSQDWTGQNEAVPPLAMAHVLAVSEVARRFPSLMEKRAAVQAKRRRSDAEIFHLFRAPMQPNIHNPAFLETFRNVAERLEIEAMFPPTTKVLILTGDTVSARMAGPAIRAWEMATQLSRKHSVRLLVPTEAGVKPDGFEIGVLSKATLRKSLDWADVVIFQGFILHHYPVIAEKGKILVADIYDPFHLENLEMFREDPAEKRLMIAGTDLDVINDQLRICDYFICASEKQRDFWLGQLAGLGRVNPYVYDDDPALRSLVDEVPFGIPSEVPAHSKNVLKGVVPGIGEDDRVILWGGGIYNWFDPLTVIRAIDEVRADHPEIKLFFMGMAHPNPEVPAMRMAAEAVGLARELGLENTHVFFNEGWVPYDDRANYLLESDIGVSCHLEHVETTYSYRTRVLDYFWAELPVVATKGDALSRLVEEKELGITVEPGDVEAFAAALRKLLEDEDFARECKLNVGKLRPDLTWSKALEPLDRFCSAPHKAPDNVIQKGRKKVASTKRSTRRSPTQEAMRLAKSAAYHWRTGGLSDVSARAKGYISRRLKGRA